MARWSGIIRTYSISCLHILVTLFLKLLFFVSYVVSLPFFTDIVGRKKITKKNTLLKSSHSCTRVYQLHSGSDYHKLGTAKKEILMEEKFHKLSPCYLSCSLVKPRWISLTPAWLNEVDWKHSLKQWNISRWKITRKSCPIIAYR